jgi:divalent metal cation (Fe/Co/Zn/Cd) transporter
MKKRSGQRTLLASMLLSAPGPLVIGAGLFLGRSTTQIADFIRRSAELVAIIVSWLVYRLLHNSGEPSTVRKEKLERTAKLFVGAAMCLSGLVMIFIALSSSSGEKGNVIPGLVIAVLGVTTNSWFWLRYRKLNREQPDAILAVQSQLYFAKALVDGCVTIALSVIAAAPQAPISRYVDLVGSLIVALYLLVNGLLTIRGHNAKSSDSVLQNK